MITRHQLLRALGVFGYDAVEPVILAALVTEDPLLLIGKGGTGKTYLLNSLSEALGLEHRHYNASLIAFDDLVGFPWPEADGRGIRYIRTPATVWAAESVLVDEISRCKPEHQNRLFSLVHERRIQGIRLENLRFRWAAMNPAGFDQDGESYAGCEALDPALADRFSFLVEVGDWADLDEDDQLAVADPAGEGTISRDGCGLRDFLSAARGDFLRDIASPCGLVLAYVTRVATLLGQAGVRISPRRVRQLARNLTALKAVSRLPREQLFRLGLQWSIPQRAGARRPDDAVLHAAHRQAWLEVCAEGEEKWLFNFHSRPDLPGKVAFLLETCDDPDTGTIAVAQFLASAPLHEAAAFSFCLAPALLEHPRPPVGQEGIRDLCAEAAEILDYDGKLAWRDASRTPRVPQSGGHWQAPHPDWTPVKNLLETLRGRRKTRATQVFGFLALQKALPPDPKAFEESLQRCLLVVKKFHGSASK